MEKYNHFDDEASALPTYNIHIMRFAEVLLTYAEAKIELNELSDGTAVNAIDRVRARVGMPGILSVDPSREGNQLKMRQIVRRERKVELAKEALMLFDMRRWRTGELQNSEPTYGYPKPIGVDPSKISILMDMNRQLLIWFLLMENLVLKEILTILPAIRLLLIN